MDTMTINPVSILMFIFSAALLVYAGWLAKSKDPRMLPYHFAAKMEHPQQYVVQVAKIVALVAAAPFLAAIVGIWSTAGLLIVLALGIVIVLCFAPRIMKKNN